MWHKLAYLITILILTEACVQASNNAMLQTKNQLHIIDNKITNLQHTIHTAHDKRLILQRAIQRATQELRQNIQQRQAIQVKKMRLAKKIMTLEREITQLNTTLQIKQKNLATHMQARYKIGKYQPIQWMVNQNKAYDFDRLLTYYSYILRYDQTLIQQIQDTQNKLALNAQQLHQDKAAAEQLQQQLTNKQLKFETIKHQHAALIVALNKTIKNKQSLLHTYENNKANLAKVLATLMKQSMAQTHFPLFMVNKKLSRPVLTGKNDLQKLHQGILFFAQEGAEVDAILPGKIVFSDWLNGYGQLLIIDHGRGLMSLYAHNKALIKKKGDWVNKGEKIAAVGHSGGIKKNGLYFEIRRSGKAIPPLQWLS